MEIGRLSGCIRPQQTTPHPHPHLRTFSEVEVPNYITSDHTKLFSKPWYMFWWGRGWFVWSPFINVRLAEYGWKPHHDRDFLAQHKKQQAHAPFYSYMCEQQRGTVSSKSGFQAVLFQRYSANLSMNREQLNVVSARCRPSRPFPGRLAYLPYSTPLWNRFGDVFGCVCRLRREIFISQNWRKG